MHNVDNVTVALLTLVNELAARCGLRSCDFIARSGTDDNANTILQIESLPGDATGQRDPRAERMCSLLGFVPGQREIVGTDEQVLNAVENALRKLPPSRGKY